ncbi:circularly permutated Ras protein 1-like [Hyperolius riggenbachi]|uniref:circularly permutated Ras protein 1-like n=1 Tax=Hyperolius riggenbachi TaxID=752182 RepID=UPI0035A28EA3
MEFGCRYIYVADSKGEIQQPSHPSTVVVSQPQEGFDVPDLNSYDNFRVIGEEVAGSTGYTLFSEPPQGSPHNRQSPDSHPGSHHSVTPPPIPNRKNKPSLRQQAAVREPETHTSSPPLYEPIEEAETNGFDAPELNSYDNFRAAREAVARCAALFSEPPQGCPQSRRSPDSSANHKFHLGSHSSVTPPPIPDRKNKPSLCQQPADRGPETHTSSPALYEPIEEDETDSNYEEPSEPSHNLLPLQANVYDGLPLPPSPKPGRRTPPPPIPDRKKKPPVCHNSVNSTKGFQDGQSSPVSTRKQQKTAPPVPPRTNTYRLSGVGEPPAYDYAYAGQSGHDVNPNVTNMPGESHYYLDVLPAGPKELQMQKTPPRTPRSLTPLPEIPQQDNTHLDVLATLDQASSAQAVTNMSGKSHYYLDVLPVGLEELQMQKTPPRTPRSLTPSLGMPQQDGLYLDVLESLDQASSAQDGKSSVNRASVTNMTDKTHYYLDVLPAGLEELQMQKAPPRTPNRSLTPSPAPPPEQRLPANCNILLLNIGKMVEDSDTQTLMHPILCCSCSASFSEISRIEENRMWTCVFCGTANAMSEGSTYDCTGGNQLYLRDSQFSNEYATTDDDTMLIFCLDISGSMSVTIEMSQDQSNNCLDSTVYQSRMEAVKCALSETLYFLHKKYPRRRVALVTFSDQVKIYGDGSGKPQVLEDCELLDTDYLKSQGESQLVPHALEKTLHALENTIDCLQENGATALGPAALVSIAMASKRPGSKVIICTDGRANTDLGDLENITEEYIYQSSRLYYSNLGDLALQHSVVVSVVTLEGTDCRLPELGLLADKTGGKVNIVHPLNLAKEFQSILDEEISATDVTVKVYLPQDMHFLYEGHTHPVLERKLGSTTPDTVLSAEFTVNPAKTKEVLRHSQLPVQVQLMFTLPDGRSRARVISQKRPVTNDSVAALESINLSVLQTHSVQFCGRLAMEGHVNEASKVALELKELIDEVMRNEKYQDQGVVYEDWENSMAPIYEDLQAYVQRDSSRTNTVDTASETPVVKSFSDEMAKMIFHMKRAKNRVLNRLKPQTA